MSSFLLKKLFSALSILIGVTFITFCLFHIVGGDPALHYAGKNASPEVVQSLRHELGLDKPVINQYFAFLSQALTWDWGTSWANHRAVTEVLREHVGASLSLTVPAYTLTVVLAIFVSLLAALHKDSIIDRSILHLFFVLMSISFVVYVVFAQKIFAFDLNLFPVYGWDTSWVYRWSYIFLPCFIYTIAHLPPKVLLFRAAIMHELEKDYVRTALAKGLSTYSIYTIHILKNAALPILTLVMSQLPALITGSVLLEAYFGIPGLGGLLLNSIQSSDLPVIKALTVVGSLFYIVVQLAHDLIAAYLDRRWQVT